LPWVNEQEAERLAVNTFLGDYRYRQQHEACSLWPRGTISAEYSRSVVSKVPVLIVTGEWDPVTPPANGESVRRHLAQSLHVVVPHGGHGLNGLEGTDCIDKLQLDFITRGTVKGLDTSCVKAIRRRGWPLAL
jgi:pimeloyl-ACP methyl ester carboxylesterase